MADQLKELAALRMAGGEATGKRKDRLEQTKLARRAAREAAKAARDTNKAKLKDESRAEAAAYKALRALEPNSRQAKAEQRRASKQEVRRVEGEAMGTCDHGVWRCRICNPVVSHK